MVDWKKFRQSTGYTQAKMSKNAAAWHRLAVGYNLAAGILNELRDRIPSDTRQFAFNAGLSLELILKAILARKQIEIPIRHDLVGLSELASVPITDNQRQTLDLLTATVIWSGRYPAPNSEAKWDEYQDVTFEAHVIRTANSAMANRETFPDWDNYSKIWNVCVTEYDKA